jgi:methionyl-tRNA synthetase
MASKKSVYITTTLPYVNAEPHVGFAMEIIRADVLARWHRLQGHDVFLNTGTDEHGAKIFEAAEKEGIDPQAYTDRYAARFMELKETLNLSVDNFIRTTDKHHISAAQEFWQLCDKNGDIYKKLYTVKYCIGCELEKTESELVEGRCPIHPNRELERREEENYFFRFSRYTEALKKHFAKHPNFVIPESRGNEMKAFLERGLEDFSISRLKSKMPWGVTVPGDETQVMYVWFDALVNYVSAIGWPTDMKKFEKWWPVIQYCGKDNTRQQSLMWQGMLMSAGIKPSEKIIIDGFITSGGQKMSKSVGKVISPFDVIETFKSVTDFPEDVLRFVLLHDIPSFEDGDLTAEGIKASYVAHLQNGIGNLTSRIMKMATTHLDGPVTLSSSDDVPEALISAFSACDLKKGIEYIMGEAKALDADIQNSEPFKVVKLDKEKGQALIRTQVEDLFAIARLLRVFLPRTAETMETLIREHKMPGKPLFNRL